MMTNTKTYNTSTVLAALATAEIDYDIDDAILADITIDGNLYGLDINPTKRKVSVYTFSDDEATLTDNTKQALIEWAQSQIESARSQLA